MNRLPSLVSPFMATKTVPGRTRRESYSTPATAGFPLWERTSAPCRSCWNVIRVIINRPRLSAETHPNPRSRSNSCPGLRRLFAGDAAADRVEVKPGVLRGLNRKPQILAEERWNLDPSLLHVKNHLPPAGNFCLAEFSDAITCELVKAEP